jgi:hypothetical protein
MSDRQNIYELLEEIHYKAFPDASVGEYLLHLDKLVGPMKDLKDGELVARLYAYNKQPFYEHFDK